MEMLKVCQELTLIDSSSSSDAMSTKRVRFQERAFPMGNVIGLNAYHVNREALKRRLADGGYTVRETLHFLVCQQPGTPTIIVHWFSPKEFDSDLGQRFMEELKPLGILANQQSFSNVFGAVVGSVFPRDQEKAWHLFGVNTLRRLHSLLAEGIRSTNYDSPVEVFATLYRRVYELHVGESLLDAGCSFGFLPLVMAEQIPALTKVVGIDLHAEPFSVTRAIAAERHLKSVQFVQADLLGDETGAMSAFDMVTVLHVLEHFTETEMYRVLTNLLKITSCRLILAVPYEPGEPEAAYGHEQLFTREKLEAVGQWCIEQWGSGTMCCEDCAGGLLSVDRNGT